MRDLLESSDNSVWACSACNREKRDRDVFEWYGKDRLDEMPKLVLSKFLKLAYRLHETQGTLQMQDPNMDGVLDIYDLGVVITHLITKLSGEPARADTGVEEERRAVQAETRGKGRTVRGKK